jgi:hypothetical protein
LVEKLSSRHGQRVEAFLAGRGAGAAPLPGGAPGAPASTAQWANRFSVAGLRLAARSSQLGPWSIYGGLAAGDAFSNIDIDQTTLEKVKREANVKEKSGNVLITGFVGARHSFTPKVGIFAELGYTISLVTVGLSTRL